MEPTASIDRGDSTRKRADPAARASCGGIGPNPAESGPPARPTPPAPRRIGERNPDWHGVRAAGPAGERRVVIAPRCVTFPVVWRPSRSCASSRAAGSTYTGARPGRSVWGWARPSCSWPCCTRGGRALGRPWAGGGRCVGTDGRGRVAGAGRTSAGHRCSRGCSRGSRWPGGPCVAAGVTSRSRDASRVTACRPGRAGTERPERVEHLWHL